MVGAGNDARLDPQVRIVVGLQAADHLGLVADHVLAWWRVAADVGMLHAADGEEQVGFQVLVRGRVGGIGPVQLVPAVPDRRAAKDVVTEQGRFGQRNPQAEQRAVRLTRQRAFAGVGTPGAVDVGDRLVPDEAQVGRRAAGRRLLARVDRRRHVAAAAHHRVVSVRIAEADEDEFPEERVPHRHARHRRSELERVLPIVEVDHRIAPGRIRGQVVSGRQLDVEVVRALRGRIGQGMYGAVLDRIGRVGGKRCRYRGGGEQRQGKQESQRGERRTEAWVHARILVEVAGCG